MKLKDYIKNKQKPLKNQSFSSPVDAVQSYSKLSEEELMQELRRVAAAEKAEGGLDSTQLDSFFTTLGPMLTPEQSSKMRRLIDELKR